MDSEWDQFRAMFPSSFGKTAPVKKQDLEKGFKDTKKDFNVAKLQKELEITSIKKDDDSTLHEENDDDFGPVPPPETLIKNKTNKSNEDEDVEDDGDQDTVNEGKGVVNEEEEGPDEDVEELPITHEIELQDHNKPVTALTLDPSGARIVSGGRDAEVKFWDFSGMDGSFKPFTSIEPEEANPVHDLQYSTRGDQILMVNPTMRAKIFDRDGNELLEFATGDPYIRDLRNTRGHVGALSCCRWHPKDKNLFLTASVDGTVRIWDVNTPVKQKSVIAYKSKVVGGRTPITAAVYSQNEGNFIVSGVLLCVVTNSQAAQDGSLSIWDTKKSLLKPAQAHMRGSGASSIAISYRNDMFVSRGLDDTVKLWDIRKFNAPVELASGFANAFEQTSICFSPDEKYLITGISTKSQEDPGHLIVMDRHTLKVVYDVPVGKGSVIKCLWHPKINQILCSTSSGGVHVLYNPISSVRGAKMCVGKTAKAKRVEDIEFGGVIMNPNALPIFAEETEEDIKWKKNEMRRDPVATRKPDHPSSRAGKASKLGSSMFVHIMKDLQRDETRNMDPREALLRHAKAAQENPYFIAPAYQKNQPKPVFAKKVYEDDEEERIESMKKRRV